MHVIAKASIANTVQRAVDFQKADQSLCSSEVASTTTCFARNFESIRHSSLFPKKNHWPPLTYRRDQLTSDFSPIPLIGHSAEHAIYRPVGLGERGVVWGWKCSYSRGIKLARPKDRRREPIVENNEESCSYTDTSTRARSRARRDAMISLQC